MAVYGKGPLMIDQQQAGMTRMVCSPSAFKAYRMEIVAPQPAQAR
jgi:hypothetical protein